MKKRCKRKCVVIAGMSKGWYGVELEGEGARVGGAGKYESGGREGRVVCHSMKDWDWTRCVA